MAQLGGYEEPQDKGGDFEPIPTADYVLAIVRDEAVEAGPNAKVPGRPMINFEFEITEGEHEGRRLWAYMMMKDTPNGPVPDPNVPGGARFFDSMCHACGKLTGNVQDTSELRGIPMVARVELTPAKKGYPAGNRVKANFRPLNAGSSPSQNAPATTSQSGGGNSSAPWKRSA